MKANARSSITLPPDELQLLESLRKQLGVKSRLEVVRRGLQLLKETTDREALSKAYVQASQAVYESSYAELVELDHLADEGLDKAKDPALRGEMAALRRAAKRALRIGLETGTPVYVLREGRIVDLTKERTKRRKKQS